MFLSGFLGENTLLLEQERNCSCREFIQVVWGPVSRIWGSALSLMYDRVVGIVFGRCLQMQKAAG